ncbi:MAG: class I mannose-6-phosphate isomerase [Anaerolineae bacterium]|nr:class I mannose-6-phosphate isomerase [Anaerolineae bacterium]
MHELTEPLRLETIYRDYVWGGNRLKPGHAPIAEAWVVYENNKILNGPLTGKTLSEAAEIYGVDLLGKSSVDSTGKRFPLLIKLLDCAQWLSLQVHPDNTLAEKLEGPGQFGKAEAWYFIDTEDGSEILCGLKPGTCSEELEEAIRNHTVLHQMQHLHPRAGDSIYIRPRTIHALGPGLLVYEVQQTSNWTYRVWDWDRPATAERPLHIEKSLVAADPALTGQLISAPQGNDGIVHRLVENAYFDLDLIETLNQTLTLDTAGLSFHALTIVSGALWVEGSNWQQPLTAMQSLLIPANAGSYRLTPESNCKVLKAQVHRD